MFMSIKILIEKFVFMLKELIRMTAKKILYIIHSTQIKVLGLQKRGQKIVPYLENIIYQETQNQF
jgi:hypothetical protein